ncbi:MAG: phosphoenolpyruvate carboxykinase (GTP) [Spartobacteria bacterium]|nr:phosphoenolpyruvate carboxykinase (GTP) [Spartobacteria bacterium]
MNEKYEALLKSKMSEESYQKLVALENKKLFDFVGEYVELCEPDSVFMCDDSDADAEYIRQQSLNKGEEHKLAKDGQTIHWDGYGDQARDKKNTKFMVTAENLPKMGNLNCVVYEEGLEEIRSIAKGNMKGKEAIVKLFCECPTMSPFSIGCAQITDSYYVSHSEDILYRRGYEHFLKMEDKNDFFRFVHSAGELDSRGCTVNLDKRRIYQDLVTNTVYSMNAQYAGNSVGLKKHSMRLAINKSGNEGWLCEHMFIMGCVNEEKDRTTYFCGAYPSACGKTATAMIPGEKIVGDDIAYFKNMNGEFRAANVERGIFGIIRDVNADDDPVIFRTLMSEKEMIFSNVLRGPDNQPYWDGMGVETPQTGDNHSGADWTEGKTDADGKTIAISHANARYTLRMEYLENLDPEWNDRNGVKVGGVIYGGRDSDTCVPVEESADWADGIILKACTLESETTAAILGKEGVRVPQPMANLDFISYPIGKYIQNNLSFVDGMNDVPRIFATNYFLKDEEGSFCTHKLAKKVWLHWAEKRVHGEVEALRTPTGFIPLYEDLQALFREIFDEDYSREGYDYQFSFRCDAWLAKLERCAEYFKKNIPDCPTVVYDTWTAAAKKIQAAKDQYGAIIKPGAYNG